MSQEKPHIPYKNQEGTPIDFERKRLEFWLDTVPEDIRRLEYGLWKRHRILHHVNVYGFEHKRKVGRFSLKPPYDKQQEQIDWESFGRSFLTGNERKEQFRKIVTATATDLPVILSTYQDRIPSEKIALIALSGSSVYGPRRAGEQLSDIDTNILFDIPGAQLNFEIMPDKALSDIGKPYHIVGTGYSETARGPHSDFHWLLQPHYPLRNTVSDGKLRDIIANLVSATRDRSSVLREGIVKLEEEIAKSKQEQIID